MCTLIALHRMVPGSPLVVAANRDEFFERPAEGLALRTTISGRIVSPLDVRAGGTWLGVNSHGLFAAVTNRRGPSPDPSRRSRGLLVTAALEARDAREAADRVEEQLCQAAYNPFNLLIADRESAFALSLGADERAAERLSLEPGAHVIGNVALRGEPSPKLDSLRRRAEPIARRAAAEVLDALSDLCRQHDAADPLAGACVHTPSYGTRSSLLLRLDAAGRGAAGGELRFSESAPCRAPYSDFTPLLHTLFQDEPRRGGVVT